MILKLRNGGINLFKCHYEERSDVVISSYCNNNGIAMSKTLFSPHNDKKFGFTLAEVLITLGVIGVVAAMTLPTLINKYQKHVYYTQFRKAASQLENAFKLYEAENGCEGDILNCKDRFGAEDVIPYFKVAQKISDENWEDVCKGNEDCEDSGCSSDLKYYAFITNDGVLYNFGIDMGTACGSLIDINGPIKGPNEPGRDVFVFYVPGLLSEKQLNVVWGGNESVFDKEDESCDNDDGGQGCAARLLKEGKMDY